MRNNGGIGCHNDVLKSLCDVRASVSVTTVRMLGCKKTQLQCVKLSHHQFETPAVLWHAMGHHCSYTHLLLKAFCGRPVWPRRSRIKDQRCGGLLLTCQQMWRLPPYEIPGGWAKYLIASLVFQQVRPTYNSFLSLFPSLHTLGLVLCESILRSDPPVTVAKG